MSYITEQNQPPGWYPESTGETSGDVTVRPLSVVENGTYTAPAGGAYNPVDVNVEAEITTEALSVIENGTYTAPNGKAYTPVNVNVPVGVTTQPLTVTENGTYTAPSGTAYTPVTVDVEASGLQYEAGTIIMTGGKFSINHSLNTDKVIFFITPIDGNTYTASNGYQPFSVLAGNFNAIAPFVATLDYSAYHGSVTSQNASPSDSGYRIGIMNVSPWSSQNSYTNPTGGRVVDLLHGGAGALVFDQSSISGFDYNAMSGTYKYCVISMEGVTL